MKMKQSIFKNYCKKKRLQTIQPVGAQISSASTVTI